MSDPSRAIALYGTEEEVPPPRVLRAGKLTAELEAGNLRYIRWGGEEVLRAVSFIVRDEDWGTYNPAISDLSVEEYEGAFRVTLHAVAGDSESAFAYDARIEGRSDGTLTFHGSGTTSTGFLTNRTGFVILHPIDGVAGEPVTIERTSGETVEGSFPEIIDPVQPMMDLRALTHTTPGGLRVRTLMEGDTYEMEDQRNWTDASYKTYVRPLALPWPYRIEPGEEIDQAITITVSGTSQARGEARTVALRPGAPIGPVPPLGLGLCPEDAQIRPRRGRRAPCPGARASDPASRPARGSPGRDTLDEMLKGRACRRGRALAGGRDRRNRRRGGGGGAGGVGRGLHDAWDPPSRPSSSRPRPISNARCPGSEWPAAPDAATLYDSSRRAFPEARIGGGMFSYFTELNRKRPPADKLDLVSFTTSPMVHAGDDRSVMETREAHGAIVASVAGIAGGTPWAVGPSAIGIRDNPYGEAAKGNPGNVRQAMNWNDPRQRGLLGAAWTLAYFADFATGGAEAVAFGGATGPFGVVHAPADFPQPWFDEHGGLFPVFHVLRGLARLRGEEMRALDLPASSPVAGLAAGDELWAANMRPDPVALELPGAATVAVLDAASFAAAARADDHMDRLSGYDGPLTLDAYAVARIRAAT